MFTADILERSSCRNLLEKVNNLRLDKSGFFQLISLPDCASTHYFSLVLFLGKACNLSFESLPFRIRAVEILNVA